MIKQFHSPLMALTKRTDILLALMLVAVIFMMILPLPTWLVDVLIALNLSSAAVLLMVGVYIKTPLQFSALPAVLLLSTLFRLALSITTTRLILLQADAGQIVYTFGDFVVAGNLIVGLVIFLIITLVQFIVITKGSERVAEVSARFSLDGLPGKQMSIDSDLRSGVITMEQARKQRMDLQKESQLYGAMDGAMKFVKGDAIAGLLIIMVNIIGGISIGVFQQGMSTSEALELYSILTIGDGLVAQIPALFVAITSGIIITRVTTEDSENLGTDIGKQILGQPRAMLVGSAISVGFAMIPGFPTVIFMVLAVIGFIVGMTMLRIQQHEDNPLLESLPGSAGEQQQSMSAESKNGITPATPLIIELSELARASLQPEALNQELAKVRRALFQDLGVPFPGVHLRFNPNLEDDRYAILLHDIPVAEGNLGINKLFAPQGEEELTLLNVPYELGDDFLPGLKTIWIDSKFALPLKGKGVELLSTPGILAHHLAHVLRRHASQFVGVQETHLLLRQMEGGFGELVKESLRAVPLNKTADILRRLVAEDVSIRDLRSILEALVFWSAKEDNPEQLTEFVRTSLNRQISYRFSAGQNILPVFMIDPAIEDQLRSQIRQTPSGINLALDPGVSEDLIETVRNTVSANPQRPGRTALLTTMDLRRHLRKLLAVEFHDMPVLSYQELAPEITVQPLGKIGLTPLADVA